MQESKIKWLEGLEEAKRFSMGSHKPILMFFHSRHCAGCHNTFNKTLTKMSVQDSITEHYVPVLFEVSDMEEMARLYNIDWTPTFIVADESGLEMMRWEGYMPEDDYLGYLNFGLARYELKKGDYVTAERRFDEVIMKHPLSDLAPKAYYYRGVAKYKGANDASWLIDAYDNLKEKYPESPWTIKASVWTKKDFAAVEEATRAGVRAACRPGVLRISAGNYGGKLGRHHYHLKGLLP